ncbi:MAG: Na+/H+ antiporter subunit B [Thermodesulfobacteriota bacterium]
MKREIISPLLSITSNLLLPLLIVFSIYLLFRGHNQPGGGFVGGLVAASAFTLYLIANGVAAAKEKLKSNPRNIIIAGLSVMLGSGLVALVLGRPFLTGLWFETPVPVIGKIGTPLIFDIGVYLVVCGITLSIIFSLAEDD